MTTLKVSALYLLIPLLVSWREQWARSQKDQGVLGLPIAVQYCPPVFPLVASVKCVAEVEHRRDFFTTTSAPRDVVGIEAMTHKQTKYNHPGLFECSPKTLHFGSDRLWRAPHLECGHTLSHRGSQKLQGMDELLGLKESLGVPGHALLEQQSSHSQDTSIPPVNISWGLPGLLLLNLWLPSVWFSHQIYGSVGSTILASKKSPEAKTEEQGDSQDSAPHCCVVWCKSLPVLGLCSELKYRSKGREASMGPLTFHRPGFWDKEGIQSPAQLSSIRWSAQLSRDHPHTLSATSHSRLEVPCTTLSLPPHTSCNRIWDFMLPVTTKANEQKWESNHAVLY